MAEPVTGPTILTVDASKALADLGEPNKPTATAPPPPAGGKLVDQLGQPFDELLHERDVHGNPKMRADGGWMLKRGNGARRAKGKPIAGAASKGYVAIAEKPAPGVGAEPTAGAAGAVVEGMPSPEPVPMLTEVDYETTAVGLTNGGFSLMRLVFGPAWEPDANERSTWTGALRRLWFHYQLPRLGPLVEVLVLIPVTIAKRRDDAKTREGFDKVRAWMGLKPKPKPKEEERAVA